jgi:RHS repeat-associated protein
VGNAKQKLTLYAGGGSGIGDAISRVTALSNEATRADEDEVYAAYAYNGAGRIVLETQKHEGDTVAELDYYQSTTPDTYDGFDRFGRVVDQKWVHGATVLDRYGYAYDANSNRTRRENVLAADRSEVYDYDMLDRLAGMDRGTLNEGKSAIAGTPARQEDWNLNQTGNWAGYHVKTDGAAVLDQTRTNNKANEITGIETPPEQTQWVQPTYDARGNMITMPKPDSPASALVCVYDAWNRMVKAKNSDGSIIATYRYDGTRRRITKLLGSDPENPTATYDYYHSGPQIVEIRRDGSEHPYKQYVWGLRYIHSPVLRWYDENADGEGVVQHYYLNDANFNVTALVDTGGNVVERYTYDPYGKVSFFDGAWQTRQSSAYANDILFTGYQLDTETGLYHTLYRPYHPTLGALLVRDYWNAYADGLNLYEYALSSPVDCTDPLGLRHLSTALQHDLFLNVLSEISKRGEGAWFPPEEAIRMGETPKPLKERAAWFCGEGFGTQGTMGAVIGALTDIILEAPKAILPEPVKKILKGKETIEDIKKEIEAAMEDYHTIHMVGEGEDCLAARLKGRVMGEGCRREILIIYDTKDDSLKGQIKGIVGDWVTRTGNTTCCNPESFDYVFEGQAVVTYHGWWIFGYWAVDSVELKGF